MANQKIVSKKSEKCEGLDDHRDIESNADFDLTIVDEVEDLEMRLRYESSISAQQQQQAEGFEDEGLGEFRDWELEEWEEVSNQILMEGR